MTKHDGDPGDQLDPRVVTRDDQPDGQDRQQSLNEIACEGDRGRATAKRAQDVRRARSPAAVGGQIDVAVDAGDDDPCRNRAEQVSNEGGQGRLLRGDQG